VSDITNVSNEKVLEKVKLMVASLSMAALNISNLINQEKPPVYPQTVSVLFEGMNSQFNNIMAELNKLSATVCAPMDAEVERLQKLVKMNKE
jgi:hypothetical protein